MGQIIGWAESRGDAALWWGCARDAWRMWQGGNQWSGWTAFLSFFRHVAKLKLPVYEQFRHWETLTELSGPRIMHHQFCMISDRPAVLNVDDQGRPHCEDGPFCRWRDGSALYAVHGVRVPAWLIEHPGQLTVDRIKAETNAEVRRIMVDRFGPARYFHETGAKLIHSDTVRVAQNDERTMPRMLVEDSGGHRWLVATDGSTHRTYYMPVSGNTETCRQAHFSICGLDESLCVAQS
jgi:hypothetical protein